MRTPGKPEVCVGGEPLTFRNIEVYRIGSGGSFEIDHWQGEGGISYTISAVSGKLMSSRSSFYWWFTSEETYPKPHDRLPDPWLNFSREDNE